MFIIFTIVYYTKLIFSKLLLNKCLTKVKTVLKKNIIKLIYLRKLINKSEYFNIFHNNTIRRYDSFKCFQNV